MSGTRHERRADYDAAGARSHVAVARPDPAQRPRIAEIRGNLIAQISEAEHEGCRVWWA